MAKFDTRVQILKYKALREVARHAWADDLLESVTHIPKDVVPGNAPTMRCCVYKERAIMAERVHLAMGGDKDNPHVIQVIDIACDDCPAGGYVVTDSCRGCLAHRCELACPRNAISFDEHQKAHIDKSKCINCGRCAQACPYSAIANRKRPCENACKVKAISASPAGNAQIDYSKCISCGSCVYQCPFGAITDKSFILDVIDMIKKSDGNKAYKVYAIVAPSIAGQFREVALGKVITAIQALGFFHVVEVALGADMVAYLESKELAERGFLTSSCCPAFVDFIKKQFPKMAEHISSNLSPMGAIAKYLKELEPDCRIVFIGPCTAKKAEAQLPEIKPYVDAVLTFEELQALFDSRDLDLASMKEGVLDNASYFGRIFARGGGLAEAVAEALKERGITDFDFKPQACSGIDECRKALLIASHGKQPFNFIEGMACIGGCINGAGCITHGDKNKADVDKYGRQALEKTIENAISVLQME